MSDSQALGGEPAALRAQVARLRAENARLTRLLKLRPGDRMPPGPTQTGMFDARPGPVHAGSAPAARMAFFGALFAAHTDVYAKRGEPPRGPVGLLPAVRGGGRVCGTRIVTTCR